NSGEGCLRLGVLCERGDGVRQDKPRAVTLYQAACDRGFRQGCVYLADMYRDGTGVTTDLRQAANLYHGACDENDADACRSLASLYEDSGEADDATEAFRVYRRACELGSTKA